LPVELTSLGDSIEPRESEEIAAANAERIVPAIARAQTISQLAPDQCSLSVANDGKTPAADAFCATWQARLCVARVLRVYRLWHQSRLGT